MAQKRRAGFHFKSPPFELGRLDLPRVGRDAEWAALERILHSVRSSRAPTIGVLLGTYGAGKTFLLWHLAKSVRPAHRSGILAAPPIRLLAPEQKRDYTRDLVLRWFQKAQEELDDLMPRLRGELAIADAPPRLKRFVNALAGLADPEKARISRILLRGGKILKKEAASLEVEDLLVIKTNDDASTLLQALQWMVSAVGVTAVALLVDETEYVENLPGKSGTAVLDSLKHLWDQQAELVSETPEVAGLALILSSTPTFWQRVGSETQTEVRRGRSGAGVTPFLARILPSNIIEIPSELSSKEARRLIVNRMSVQRDRKPSPPIIPFTEDYVSYVYELSQGLPRRIIEICAIVLDAAEQRGVTEIDRSAAVKILEELLIIYEPLEGEDDEE